MDHAQYGELLHWLKTKCDLSGFDQQPERALKRYLQTAVANILWDDATELDIDHMREVVARVDDQIKVLNLLENDVNADELRSELKEFCHGQARENRRRRVHK